MKQPTVFILSCGDELLFGHTVDTNAAWLAEECTILGWRVIGHRTVGDVTPDIIDAFREGAAKADAVILTGGLGPTEDDRTRHALAEAMGTSLEERPELVGDIEAMFRRFNRPMQDSNRVQALIPKGASAIRNPVGTAPGIHAKLGNAEIFVAPGVPREMRELFKIYIKPRLEKVPVKSREVLRRLHLFGKGESDIGAAIRDLMREKNNPEVGTAVAEGVITVRMYAKGETGEEAEAVAAAAEADIRKRLGDHVFGADGESLGDCAVKLLKDRGAVLATTESCSGGMLSSLAVDVPGASDVFMEGIIAYDNRSKRERLGVPAEIIEKHGAVSYETAAAMARGAWPGTRFGDKPAYSLAVTGIAGPDGGTEEKPAGTVFIACAFPNGGGACRVRVFKYNTVASRNGVRLRASHAALDFLRRTILSIPYAWETREG